MVGSSLHIMMSIADDDCIAMGVTRGAGTTYPSLAHKFTNSLFLWGDGRGLCCSYFTFLCRILSSIACHISPSSLIILMSVRRFTTSDYPLASLKNT